MSDILLYPYLKYGTNAERLAFVPDPLAVNKMLYQWYTTDTGLFWVYDTSWHQISSGGTVPTGVNQHRLSLTTATPVTTADVVGASTLYFTPYIGNQVALYTGTAWTIVSLAQISLALSGLTSGKPYDVFVNYNSGTPQLELVVWTNDTTRATALATQDGVLVKTGAATRKYVGTIYTTATTTTEDSQAKRFVWNMYNRVPRPMAVTDTTNTWSYGTATWRQANASVANQLDYVCGQTDCVVSAQVLGLTNASATTSLPQVGIGIDSTTVKSSFMNGGQDWAASSVANPLHAFYRGYPGVGRHFLAWLEIGAGSGTQTWLGDDNLTIRNSGMMGELLG